MQMTDWIELTRTNKVASLQRQLEKSWYREGKLEQKKKDLEEVIKYFFGFNWQECKLCPATEYNGRCPLQYRHPPDFAECLPRMIAAVKNE